jgi:nucleotide-binding universal stress UspA family protein
MGCAWSNLTNKDIRTYHATASSKEPVMYNKILVPLDGSKRAEAILPHAAEMANRYGAEIIFLRVEELFVMLEWDEVVDLENCREKFEARRKTSEAYLTRLKTEFQDKGIRADARLVHGPVVKSLLSVAEDMDVDIVLMASHGIGGLHRTFYGSVTASALQKIDRPLLIIRTRRLE